MYLDYSDHDGVLSQIGGIVAVNVVDDGVLLVSVKCNA